MPTSQPVDSLLRKALTNASVPDPLQDALLRAADEIADNYGAGHLRPTELSGSDFTEAAFRVVQHIGTGTHTALKTSLPRLDKLLSTIEQYTGIDDSLRIHVPRVLRSIYDIRNRRGVAHIPSGITANQSDAELILATVKWVIVEFIRLYHSSSHDEVQQVVDNFVVWRPALVEVFEGEPRIVTDSDLSAPDKVLVLLYWHEPEKPTRRELGVWLRDLSSSNVTKALNRLTNRNEIHVTQGARAYLTALGRVKARNLIAEHSPDL